MQESLPDTFASWMDSAAWAMGIVVVAWMALGLYGWLHRRAYRLTIAEKVSDPVAPPEFLQPRPEPPAAALQGAADGPPAQEAFLPSWIERLVVGTSMVAAILTMGLAGAAVILVGGPEVVESPLLADGWSSLLEHRWPVLGVAFLVICFCLQHVFHPPTET